MHITTAYSGDTSFIMYCTPKVSKIVLRPQGIVQYFTCHLWCTKPVSITHEGAFRLVSNCFPAVAVHWLDWDVTRKQLLSFSKDGHVLRSGIAMSNNMAAPLYGTFWKDKRFQYYGSFSGHYYCKLYKCIYSSVQSISIGTWRFFIVLILYWNTLDLKLNNDYGVKVLFWDIHIRFGLTMLDS